ncbi:MAG: glycerate kinase [Rhodospirillaceae bacterium]|nr:glycerate kinase [Rhodospirillaceae bacterium]MBL6942216.1 glycerate kinase [Rhodospirillales bacterium]
MSQSLLRDLYSNAVAAADPKAVLAAHLPSPPKGRTVVVGAGKAAASMARAVEENWSGPISGLVVTRYDHSVPCDHIEVVEAAHPVPDAAGREAAARIVKLLEDLGPDDLALCLISGGGSALLSLPGPGISLEDKQDLNSQLLKSGAPISEMNCVRKHLSAIKGGRLALAAWPARVLSLAISDVPGDDPAVIASGPTVADPTTLADARKILAVYGIEASPAIVGALQDQSFETPKPGDERLDNAEMVLIATPQMALEAAAKKALAEGITPLILGDAIEGEAREVARVMAGIATQVCRHGQPVARPCVLLSGGETTVTLRGKGRGGRNAEFLLALAIALDGLAGVSAIACDTDGIDGSEDNAGCVIGPDTLARARALGLDAEAYLTDNDAYSFFDALGDLVISGPTLTNVNDFRAILIQ